MELSIWVKSFLIFLGVITTEIVVVIITILYIGK